MQIEENYVMQLNDSMLNNLSCCCRPADRNHLDALAVVTSSISTS